MFLRGVVIFLTLILSSLAEEVEDEVKQGKAYINYSELKYH